MEKYLALPGNPRYQPKDLVPIFGYDNLAHTLVEVEVAALRTLGSFGVVPKSDMALLTPEVLEKLLAITTSAMDTMEREVTKHDIRALVRLMQEVMPPPLRRWVHVPLTSYDVVDTARTLQFVRAHKAVVRPKVRAVARCFLSLVSENIGVVQIGRTHGQHALPVTVGFWLATILSRVLWNAREMERYAAGLVGKISGAVGAYNEQVNLRIVGVDDDSDAFEREVLKRLGLEPAPISTQILPPEPLAYYLYSALMLSASLGQFGRDARHLMRTEIGEIAEPFTKGQVGSSTMAHKRNPLHFEQLEGMWLKTKNEFGKVLDTLISEHQRDLVGSSLARDFPTIIVNVVAQLNTLLRADKEAVPFLSRLVVDAAACERNFAIQGDLILAEPLYLALQMYGYAGDAHDLVNHRAVPLIGTEVRMPSGMKTVQSLYEAMEYLAAENDEHDLERVWWGIPQEVRSLLQHPERYTGDAVGKAGEIVLAASAYLEEK